MKCSRPLLVYLALAPDVHALEGLSLDVMKVVVLKAVVDNLVSELREYRIVHYVVRLALHTV